MIVHNVALIVCSIDGSDITMLFVGLHTASPPNSSFWCISSYRCFVECCKKCFQFWV